MIRLLDVNLLIALIDPEHVHHELAHGWFGRNASDDWATCPLTENGTLRIVANRRYSGGSTSPEVVAMSLCSLVDQPRHRFIPDDLSLLASPLIRLDRLATSAQITDTYLLALAVAHDGRLATLDRRLVPDAVVGGAERLEIVGR